MSQGAAGSRRWQGAVGKLRRGTWVPDLARAAGEQLWGFLRSCLFHGLWEDLEHRFTEKMDVWITSFEQTYPLVPLCFYHWEGKLISETLWSVKSSLRPCSPTALLPTLHRGDLLGKASRMNFDGLKREGRLSKAWRDESATRIWAW